MPIYASNWTDQTINKTHYSNQTTNATNFTDTSINKTSWESDDVPGTQILFESLVGLLFENGDIALYE